ncbi:MAG: hypothetical protein ABN482_07275 [Corticimicrobacter sp.]|uniref:hypothetical protein n=1 Tax=Corticimicrobacter sp. TaxID=2678536 RepID=UPI0032DA0F5E
MTLKTLMAFAMASLSVATTTASSQSAPPQAQGAFANEAYEIARNMNGLADYCQRQGYIQSGSVEDARKLLPMVESMSPDKSGGDAAEAYGSKGYVLDGTRPPVRLAESELGESEWCQQAAESWRHWATQLAR